MLDRRLDANGNEVREEDTFTLTVEIPKLNPYSKRQYDADVMCGCCGRGIPNRDTAFVIASLPSNHPMLRDGIGMTPAPGTRTRILVPISGSTESIWNDGSVHVDPYLGRDSVEWGTFIGSSCAKQIPKEFKVSQKKVVKIWSAAGCP